jgi:hypothetical protein
MSKALRRLNQRVEHPLITRKRIRFDLKARSCGADIRAHTCAQCFLARARHRRGSGASLLAHAMVLVTYPCGLMATPHTHVCAPNQRVARILNNLKTRWEGFNI